MRPVTKKPALLVLESEEESNDTENDSNLIYSNRRKYIPGRKSFSRVPVRKSHIKSITNLTQRDKSTAEESRLTYSSDSSDDINIMLDERARSFAKNQAAIRASPRHAKKNIYSSRTTKSTSEMRQLSAADHRYKSGNISKQKNPSSPSNRQRGQSKNKGSPSKTQLLSKAQHPVQKSSGNISRNKSPSSSSRRKQKKPKKKRSMVLKTIIDLQSRTDNLIPKLPFSRLIREILVKHGFSNNTLRITPEALFALQEVSEMYLVQFFQDSYRCTIHRNRVTLMPKDMELVSALRNHISE